MKLSWVHVAVTAAITALASVSTEYPHLVWVPIVSATLGVLGTIGVSSIGQNPPKGESQ